MENKKDEPHLKIETVTPDTEKDGLPNDQKYNHPVPVSADKDEVDKLADLKSEAEDDNAVNNKAKENAEETKAQADESQDHKKPDQDDERSKIETVSP